VKATNLIVCIPLSGSCVGSKCVSRKALSQAGKASLLGAGTSNWRRSMPTPSRMTLQICTSLNPKYGPYDHLQTTVSNSCTGSHKHALSSAAADVRARSCRFPASCPPEWGISGQSQAACSQSCLSLKANRVNEILQATSVVAATWAAAVAPKLQRSLKFKQHRLAGCTVTTNH